MVTPSVVASSAGVPAGSVKATGVDSSAEDATSPAPAGAGVPSNVCISSMVRASYVHSSGFGELSAEGVASWADTLTLKTDSISIANIIEKLRKARLFTGRCPAS